jgi:hypothetical protein
MNSNVRCSSLLVHGGLEAGSCRELHALGCRDLNRLTRARVATRARRALGTRPSAETGNRDLVVASNCALHDFDEAVDDGCDVLLVDTTCRRVNCIDEL